MDELQPASGHALWLDEYTRIEHYCNGLSGCLFVARRQVVFFREEDGDLPVRRFWLAILLCEIRRVLKCK